MGQNLWGIKSGNEVKPSWLNDDEKENAFATNSGWVLRHPSGIDETLVAVADLKTKLGATSVTEVKFGSGAYTAGASKTVRVTYNEKVTVTGSPTLSVTGSVAGAITATYASTTGQGNVLVFNFTVPAAANILSIASQSISLAGGTVVETSVSPTVNAALVIDAATAAAAGTKTAI